MLVQGSGSNPGRKTVECRFGTNMDAKNTTPMKTKSRSVQKLACPVFRAASR